jgi:hypothetical protein
MLIASPGLFVKIPFVYKDGYEYLDPSSEINIYLNRGFNSTGARILGPYIYSVEKATAASPTLIQYFSETDYVERISEGSYELNIKVPLNLFDGVYTIGINTKVNGVTDLKEINLENKTGYSIYAEPTYGLVDKTVALNPKSKYRQMGQFDTNNLMLIGHTDAMEPYGIQKIVSMQNAIDLLRGDMNSPLLRGVFDAYSCGARDIYVMSAGYMSEYVSKVSERNIKIFKDSLNETYSFYESYYDRLSQCYKLLEEYEFLDVIVPLEISIVNTGGVNFVKQLANFCYKIQQNTGEITIGIAGSKNDGVSSSDVTELLATNFDIQSVVDTNGYITKDTGKHVLLVYGEAIFAHKQMQLSYSNSVAAAVAGMLCSNQVNKGLSKQKIPSALSIHGANLNVDQVRALNAKNINTIVRGGRSRKTVGPYDTYLTSDYTQSVSDNFKDSSNIRLAAMVIAEVQAMAKNSIGKFSYAKTTAKVETLLSFLKENDIIRDYKLEAFADKEEKSKIYFSIVLISSRTLREISFNVSTGRGA